MNISRQNIIHIIIIFIISFLLVFDLFINKGQSTTFDGPTHMANIAHFYKSILEGEWHVTWTDGFANYGMPLGIIAQQATSYIGAWINFGVHNVVLSYNLTFFIGAFFSVLFFYLFLRLYFKPTSALLGAFLFNFAPYRIINIYIRGSLPEFFASVPVPLILIGIYLIFNKNEIKGFFLLTFSFAFLILIHPMMVIVSGFIFIPYLLFCFMKYKKTHSIIISILAMIFGLGIAGYYILPLMAEIKYFYYGLAKNHFGTDQYLNWTNFLNPNWYYFTQKDVFTRGHFIQSGLFETIIISIGFVFSIYYFIKKKKIVLNLVSLSVILAIFLFFMMMKSAAPLYKSIDILGSYQHQWRLFSAFIFLPPIILSYLFNKYNNKILLLILIFIICIIRFPQIYGKNYTIYPENHYFFTNINLHANIMNIIWTGETTEYPIKSTKSEIIEGKGTIVQKEVRSSLRNYQVNADGNVRMADYTFYFPGWHVYVDGNETIIQFQDPSYRGVITYDVPNGKHDIKIVFKNTKIRLLGICISILSLILLSTVFIFRSRIMFYKQLLLKKVRSSKL